MPKFSYPINFKGLVNTCRSLGKHKIKMQQNFYIPKIIEIMVQFLHCSYKW